MRDSKTPGEENQLTLISRLTESMAGRKWSFFTAELVLVVAGILIALAIDGQVSDWRDRQTEATYLELLTRDISETRHQAELQQGFEKEIMDIGLEAYAIMDAPDTSDNSAELGVLLGSMSTRRTLRLSSATFDQIVSSGHLQLIHNKDLRDQLVRFFAQMALLERIAEKNNQDLIDDIYVPFLMRKGITVYNRPEGLAASVHRGVEILDERLKAIVQYPEDRILSAPPESDSWNEIRRQVLFRIRIAAIGQALSESIWDQCDDMAEAIATELGDG